MAIDNLDFSRYQLGWSDEQIPVFKPKKGINEAIVREMSGIKNEEKWMLEFPPQCAQEIREEADGAVVCRPHAGPRLQRHLLLHQAHRESS
jgi:hypothetical protein